MAEGRRCRRRELGPIGVGRAVDSRRPPGPISPLLAARSTSLLGPGARDSLAASGQLGRPNGEPEASPSFFRFMFFYLPLISAKSGNKLLLMLFCVEVCE